MANEVEAPPAGRGRTPASRARREAIIAAAKSVFFEDGYQLASMDRIAERAGTTKRTVYDHFGSKEGLFSAVIEFGCRLFVDALPKVESLPPEPRTGINAFLNHVAAVVAAPDGIRFQRLVIAEAERYPEFGEVLYQTALVGAEAVLVRYLDGRVAAAQLAVHDTRMTARLLMDLATNSVRLRGLLSLKNREDSKFTDAARAAAVDLFLDRFGQAVPVCK